MAKLAPSLPLLNRHSILVCKNKPITRRIEQ